MPLDQDAPEIKFGFWISQSEPNLPRPLASIFDNTDAVKLLDEMEREATQHGGYVAYRGISTCRICGKMNGNGEYRYPADGHWYTWPSGLRHYLEDHNIEPPPAMRDLIDYHAVEFKLKRENPLMDLFPFNEHNVEDDEIVAYWNEVRPRGTTYSRINIQVLSATSLRLIVMADGEEEPVHDKEYTVEVDVLKPIIDARKFSLAAEEYKERERVRREPEIRALVRLMFGE